MDKWGSLSGLITTTTVFLLTSGTQNKYRYDPVYFGIFIGVATLCWKCIGDYVVKQDFNNQWIIPLRTLAYGIFTSLVFICFIAEFILEFIKSNILEHNVLSGYIAFLTFFVLNKLD